MKHTKIKLVSLLSALIVLSLFLSGCSKVYYSTMEKLGRVLAGSTQKMYPVLAKLKDYVLYLKHNLNAQAVGSLGGEVVSIEKDVKVLIEDMTASIKEAQNFINNFQ